MLDWYPDWSGQTCFILGGGPSLAGFNAERLKGRRVIAINEAGLTLAPWADVLFWGDLRWHKWNKRRLHLHSGPIKVFRHEGKIEGAHRIPWEFGHGHRDKRCGMASDRRQLGGRDSGSAAINLAVNFNAARIVLLGFDMRDGDDNWHDEHREAPERGSREHLFIPAHQAMAEDLARHPVSVLNATPGSAMTCWPMADLGAILHE